MSKHKNPDPGMIEEETLNDPATQNGENAGNPADVQIPEMSPEEITKLLEDTKALYETYSNEHEQMLRLAAEYDNYRKRSQKERESVYNDARADAALSFLPVYDNLERALAQPTTDEAYAKGVELIAQGFVEILDKMGIKPTGVAGEEFDPQFHSALMHIEDESLPKNVVAEVFQKGYVMGDKVLRFALVKVAN